MGDDNTNGAGCCLIIIPILIADKLGEVLGDFKLNFFGFLIGVFEVKVFVFIVTLVVECFMLGSILG